MQQTMTSAAEKRECGLEAPRHHVLLYSAALAFIGGFANEAIAVLNTALERAYEHYIRVICRVKGADITSAP
jgi:hypothetical protein